MTLAFKLYGDFVWPPKPGKPPIGEVRLQSGIVAIHFLTKPSDSGEHPEPRALLHWLPVDRSDPGKAQKQLDPEGAPNLFAMTPTEAIEFFENRQEKQVSVWIDEGIYLADRRYRDQDWLSFRGAFLFEQFRHGPPDAPILDVQWPLVSSCEYYKDKTTYSLFEVGNRRAPIFRFNFNLPLPVPRTRRTGSWRNVEAFPFSAVFAAIAPTNHLSVKSLVGGWVESTASGPDIPGNHKTSFPFARGNPKKKQLGQFGFAPSGTKQSDFAIYSGEANMSLDQHWPAFRWPAFSEVLSRYGFKVRPHNVGDASNGGPIDFSLRFAPIVDKSDVGGGFQSRLTYRVSVPRRDVQDEDLKSGRNFTEFLHLRLDDEIGGSRPDATQYGGDEKPVSGWLHVGEVLFVDCEVEWEIAPGDIWSLNRSIDWSPTVKIRMHWLETIPDTAEFSAQVQPDATRIHFGTGLLAQAGYSFIATRESLDAGEVGLPHSFLPTLSKSDKQSVRFALYGSPVPAYFDENGLLGWGAAIKPSAGSKLQAWRRPPMRLSLASEDDRLFDRSQPRLPQHNEERPEKLTLQADGLTFFRKAGTVVEFGLEHDVAWPPKSLETIEDDESFFASYKLTVTATSKEWTGRLASLEFSRNQHANGSMAAVISPDDAGGRLRIGGAGVRHGSSRNAPRLVYPEGRVAAELIMTLPVTSVVPLSVDMARTDRSGRSAPLLIPLEAAGAPVRKLQPETYWLKTTERISPRHDRLVTAEITEQAEEQGARSYVVLSAEPFSVYRFTQKPLSDRGQADNAQVAFYSGDDRIWQFKKVSEFYHYTLPPQAVGESADKPRRLEIHDLPDGSTEMPPRPFVLNRNKEGNFDEEMSSRQRRAVEYRLTPSAEIWIRPSDVERGYFMPEQTSYEIFRQFGAYGLGAALAYMRAEFLYGMPVGIDVSKERSIARGARVAEIEALTGRMPGPARTTTAEIELSDRWNALRAAVARRPERLEIWARDLDSAIDFTPARFADGVRFALRNTALHRSPLIQKQVIEGEIVPESEDDHKSFPRVGGIPAATEGRAPKPRHHPKGLSGGAFWPVESLNLFKILLDSPESNGGAIESIALSPFGGDATQKAEFLGGKVTIISQTRNGRIERQQVEVLGRICAFWHRAKHVVVYERTVNPSAQFAPKPQDDPHKTRSRRPILRKVREYIELLQPERGYPDFSTAVPRSSGFLERVRFNSKIINVDSAWSSDVGDYGWQIPLWNRASARERPQVYQMPDVAFVTTAEGDGDRPVVAQDCRDPDYLFFFADLKAKTSDTNMWDARLDLDYPNMPLAQAMTWEVDKSSAEQPADGANGAEGRRRSVGRFLPGLRRFTWRLGPAAQKTAINAGRSGKPVYVGLDSVTFMRATHVDVEHKVLIPGLRDLLPPRDFETEELLAGADYWQGDGQGTAIGQAKQFADFFKDDSPLFKAIKDRHPNDVLTQWGELEKTWIAPDGGIRDGVLARLGGKDKFPDLKGFVSPVASGNLCEKLKSDAVGIIKRKEMLVRLAMQDWVADSEKLLEKLLPDISGPIPDKEQLITRLTIETMDYIRPLFAEASQDITDVGQGVEKARSALIDIEVEIEAALARARQRIEQCIAGYDKEKPWSDARRAAFRAGVNACLSSIGGDIQAAIDETRQRLGVELSSVSQAIAGHIAKALKTVALAEADATDRIATIQGAVDRLLRDFEYWLVPASDTSGLELLKERINNKFGSTINKPLGDEAIARIDTLIEAAHRALSAARSTARAVDAAADRAAGEVGSEIEALMASIAMIGTSLNEAFGDLFELHQQLIDAGAEDVAEDLGEFQAELTDWLEAVLEPAEQQLKVIGTAIEAVVVPAKQWLDEKLETTSATLRALPEKITTIADDIQASLMAVQKALAPNALLENVVRNVLQGALTKILAPVAADLSMIEDFVSEVRPRLNHLTEEVGEHFRQLSEGALGALDDVSAVCSAINQGVSEAEAYLNSLAERAHDYLNEELTKAHDAIQAKLGDLHQIEEAFKDAEGLIDSVKSFDRSVRALHNDLGRAYETARMFADRVFDAASKIDQGGAMAVPCNILKLYSAVTTAPELAVLKADIDRIRAGFDEFADIIETTKANALFNRLGDELKGLGLSLPFDKIGDRLLPADLSSFDIGKVFRNFGGAKLDNLFHGYRIPAGVREAVRITHDFDQKQARAWVQVDIDAPMPGRRSLFSIGPFKIDFVDMRLTGQVRLEASKGQEKVTQSGFGRIGTVIDTVVGGQSMVRFEKFALKFSKEGGLDVEFDPKNIRLNPTFQFIQDFLSTIFPDEVGGLQVIKQDGMPIGVEHEFVMPNLSLNFATSGVSNISLENRFKLLAFPDFIIANRFNLSTVERPFIFSIFIIGGAGYIQIESEYRPFNNELTVIVDAGAGGSASLAFAFGPFSGQVFITLSGVLSYRKLLGRPGGGLSVSVVLVIAGHVDVAGIVTVGLTLMLRMTYRDNGQVDADGTLSVTIRISKFFKLKARANVKYKLRGGKSQTVVTSSVSGEIEDENIKKKADKLKDAAKKLEEARN